MTRSLVIDSPGLRSLPVRLRDTTLRGALWAIWLTLVTPAASFIMWSIVAYTPAKTLHIETELGRLQVEATFIGVAYAWLFAVILLGTIIWSIAARAIAKHSGERRSYRTAIPTRVAAHFGVPATMLEPLGRAVRMRVHHHATGHIRSIEILERHREPQVTRFLVSVQQIDALGEDAEVAVMRGEPPLAARREEPLLVAAMLDEK